MNTLAAFPLKTTLALVLLSYVIVRYAPPVGSAPGTPKQLTIQYGMNAELLETAEFYPLSSFRMYSKFSPYPIYVYITDENDQPIAHQDIGQNIQSSAIKKDFDRRLRVLKKSLDIPMRDMTPAQKFPIGNATLLHVIQSANAEKISTLNAKSLRLHEVTLTLAPSGGVQKSTELVGEIPL